MSSCPACHAENPAGHKFCGECGTRLPSACPVCSHPNPAGQKFCGDCGAPLDGAPKPAAETTGVATPREAVAPLRGFRDAVPATYTPKHLAEKILGTRAAFEGERKQVTVLFADVSGFTAMSEKLDPEDVHAIMDRAFEIILDAVHRYEGTINQFLGDGVMALFGAPIAHEDHAHRALRAALAIQDDLSPLKREIRQRHGVKFRVRMGINTGLVVVGAIGRDLRMDYTAVGDTTNLAARLLTIAGPGQIVVSARTRQLTDGFFVFEDLGAFSVKGKSEPVRASEVKREIRGRTRLEVSRERGLTPLVGREREIGQLTEAYRQVADGSAAVVVLAGEPGVGKSRLLYEWLRRLEGSPLLELEASCFSHTRSVPYHVVSELLRRAVRVPQEAGDEEVRARIADRLAALDLGGDEPATLLAHFLGVAAPPEFLARLTGAQIQERAFQVFRDLLLRAAAEQPLVVVVENLHWLDASSEEFLKYLVSHLAHHRVLLLLSTRPGPMPSWVDGSSITTVTLEGLGSGDVQHMVHALLGTEAVASELLNVLLAKGEGNPLYLEEILRQLRETGGLVVERGEARLGDADVRVPETIHDIIAARIDRLADPLKQTLQVAAVVGREFSMPLLSRVLQVNGALATQLHDLQSLDFVFRTREVPEPVYTFKHALTQEVAYAGLLERRRRVHHAAVGHALEELYEERTEEVVELLAYQFGRSGEDEKAVDYAILAGEKAQRHWATAEALAYFTAALQRLPAMPDTPRNHLRRIDAVVKQSEIMFALGRHAEQVQALEGIRELVEQDADTARRAAWYYWAGFLHNLTGASPEVSIGYCRRAVEIAEAPGLEEIRAAAECCLCHVYALVGELRGAIEAGERALALFEARGNVWWACRTLWGLTTAANSLGEWRRSLRYCHRALEHAQTANDHRLKVVGWWRTGWVHIRQGDVNPGLRCCDEALSLSPRPFDAAFIKAARGYGLIKAGEAAAGMAEVAEAVGWFEQSQLRYTRAFFALWLAEGHLRQGESRTARAILEEVRAVSREAGYRHVEGLAERLLGEAVAGEDSQAAAVHLEAGARILEEVGARDELARALAALGRLRRAAGDDVEAARLLERALAIFEAVETLDEPARIRATLAAVQAARLGSGAVIVSRDQEELYRLLSAELAGTAGVQLILDRRQGERRRAAAGAGSERRRSDRRRQPDVDVQLRSSGYAILPYDAGA